MKKKITVITLATIVAATGTAFGSGYRIPEQSMNSVALSSAYVAHTQGADTSYFNPANMSWQEEDWHSEANLTYINLTSVEFTGTNPSYNAGSRTEQFVMPDLHAVSPDYNNFRFGLSIVHPYGLSKRWDSSYQRTFAEEFTLHTYEMNPTVSYKFSDTISMAAGARIMHSKGKVKSYGTTIVGTGPTVYSIISRDLEGDFTGYGYNLALSYRPTKRLALAATYRSKIELDLEGTARLTASDGFLGNGAIVAALADSYDGWASVSVPAPAVLTLASSYTFGQTTVELTYDKTFWNAYNNLDFNYSSTLGSVLTAAFDNAIAKNWTNSEAYRIGVTHQFNEQWTMMAAFAIDKNPVPDNTLGFELPDSDAKVYSLGARYQYSDKILFGLAYLYDDKESRTVSNAKVDGTFNNAAAHLLSANLQYRF